VFHWYIAFFPDDNPETKADFGYAVTIADLFIGASTTIRSIEDYFNNIYSDFIKKFKINDQPPDPAVNIKVFQYKQYCIYEYKKDPRNLSKVLCALIFDSVQGYAPGPVGFSKSLFFSPNQDAIDFFGSNFFQPDLKFEKYCNTVMWDRRELYILSSLALSSDKNGYLGHSRPADYIPIKYYRLDSDDKEFWIELFSEREHRCDVNNLQKVSDLYFEMIFMYSANSML
jgi:hypothetical protein